MKYKMIVLDMDDTLLTDDHKISNRNKQAILKAQEMGVYVVLASGRPTLAMVTYAKELKLDFYNSHIISYNGGVVSDMKTNEVLFEKKLTKNQAHDLYDYSISKNTSILTYIDEVIVSELDTEFIAQERSITGMKHRLVKNFKEAVQNEVVKCILTQSPEFLIPLESDLKKAMPDLSVTMSKPFFLEVAPNGIDKSAGIQFLAKKLQINQQEIIAVGNASNDLAMVQYAGLGVWVDNVNPELRHLSDLIVSSNNHDGVAEVIEKYLLKNKV
jgi:Cof subfamily protein (haloacid dehalogenase superfamily)